ncbi:MAG TPA: hypothetical protein VGG20_22395 [Thermoanaerobaculia bacterium]|jgi:hypothetical protein
MLSEILRFGSTSIFLLVVAGLLFLLLAPRPRRKTYLSLRVVRRFVEYFGNVDLGDEGYGMPSRHERKATGQA